jgi:hypothetical protein
MSGLACANSAAIPATFASSLRQIRHADVADPSQHCGTDFHMFPFANGRPPGPRRLVETTLRIASAPSIGVAREEARVVVDGVEQRLEIVRQERIHGRQAYWACPTCGKLRWHLYLRDSQIGCRICLGLTHFCNHTRNRAALRARKLRRKLGAAPGLLSALPSRPRHWRRDYWT